MSARSEATRDGKMEVSRSENAPDPTIFRRALSQFATGIVIVTTSRAGEPVGITVSSFNSVSLDPPLILFSIDKKAHSLAAFLEAEAFAISVVSVYQEHLASQFARASADKWQGVGYRWSSERRMPLIDDALVHFEGRRFASHEAGDHVIYIGRVEAVHLSDDLADPLIFFRSRYRRISAAP